MRQLLRLCLLFSHLHLLLSSVIQDSPLTLEGEKKSDVAADDDDGCVILDGDPDKALVIDKEKNSCEKDGPEEELHVLGEKARVLNFLLTSLMLSHCDLIHTILYGALTVRMCTTLSVYCG